MDKTLYTAKQLSEILGLNLQTVYRMAHRNEIESVKIGSRRRFIMPKQIAEKMQEDS